MKIGAALLSNNTEEFLKQVEQVKNVDFIQIDLMDGTFTSEQTIWGGTVEKALKKTKLPVELHLMINNPEEKLDQLTKLKVETIIFHYESTQNHKTCIDMIKKAKKKVGIAIKPNTSATVLRKLLSSIDMVLVLTVNPGAQGQKFQVTATKNIGIIREYDIKKLIEVDGGVTPHVARMVKLAGATSVVSGSYLQSANYDPEVVQLFKDA